DRGGGRDPARVRVLDDGDGGGLVVVRGAQGGIRIDVVVVRHLLAAVLHGLGDAVPAEAAVERRTLVGVLTVAQHVAALPARAGPRREAGALVVGGDDGTHPARDGDVVDGRVPEGVTGELAALGER